MRFSPMIVVCGVLLAFVTILADSQIVSAEIAREKESTNANQALKSGRVVGDGVPSFFVRTITGPLSNKSVCYVCRNGDRPVVMILMRRLSPKLNHLLKEVDKIVDKNRAIGLRSFGVLINDAPVKVAPQLQTLAFDEKIALPLTVATRAIASPSCQNIHQDAEVTIVLYRKQRVVSNYGFRSGELTKKEVTTLLQRIHRFTKEEAADASNKDR